MSSASTDHLLQEDGAADIQDYRERLLLRFEALNSERNALSSRINSVAPVSRLPPEVISDIIKLLAASLQDDTWIRVTHVCREWRKIAIQCSTLWSKLSFKYPALTEAKLIRSGNVPLDIKFDGVVGPAFASTLQEALSDGSRLRTIEIRPTGQNDVEFHDIFSRLSGPLPILESLCLVASQDMASQSWPEPLSKVDVPCLRRLELERCTFTSWSHIPLSAALTSLKLTGNHYIHTFRPKAREFYGTFKHTPNLRTLDLRDSLPTADAAFKDAPVVLPALESLTIQDRASAINAFITTVRIHESTKLIFKATYDPTIEPDNIADMVFLHLPSSWPTAKTGIRKLRVIEPYQDLQYSLALTFNDEHQRHSPELLFKINERCIDEDQDQERIVTLDMILTSIQQRLDLSALRSLEVAFGTLDRATWASTFSRLPSLREITFVHCAMHHAPPNPAIHGFLHSLTTRTAGTTPYSSLKSVTLMVNYGFQPFHGVVDILSRSMHQRPESMEFEVRVKKLPKDEFSE